MPRSIETIRGVKARFGMKVVTSVLVAGLSTWIGGCSSSRSASSPATSSPASTSPATSSPATSSPATTSPAAASVCSARSDLQNAVQAFRTSVSNANFGQARTDLTNISTAADHLSQEIKNLKASEQQALTPQIDSLKTEIANLKKAQSVADLRSGLSTIGSQAQSIYSQITETVSCS